MSESMILRESSLSLDINTIRVASLSCTIIISAVLGSLPCLQTRHEDLCTTSDSNEDLVCKYSLPRGTCISAA